MGVRSLPLRASGHSWPPDMAPPRHRPDEVQRRQVEALAGYGVTEKEIGGLLSIDAKTLRKYYRFELDHGHSRANAKVAENLYRKATGEGREAVTAAIFWLKARAGWREVSVHQHGGEPHNPITEIRRIIIEPPQREPASRHGLVLTTGVPRAGDPE
jgi:hypothetical protein